MDYITLVKGDDTNFIDDQYIKIKFVTDLDFTGFTGYFTLGGVTLNYTNISSKVINVVLNNSFTSALTVGKQYAELKLKDTQNRYRTITSVIPIKVVDVVTVQPTYVNNVIECHSDVNNTTIEVKIETAGIAKSTADEYVTTMESLKVTTEQSSNLARTNAQHAALSEENAKLYSEMAKTAQSNASSSAMIAQTASEDALEYKNEAKTYAEMAVEKEVQSNWSEDNDMSKAYIKNKPTKLSEFEDDITLQSDFNQTNTESKDFIKNKPRIKTWTTTVSTTWVGSESPYTQEITLAGMLATDNVLIALKSNSATSIKDCQKELSKIFFAETLDGKLKLYAKSPTKTAINLLVYESEKE